MNIVGLSITTFVVSALSVKWKYKLPSQTFGQAAMLAHVLTLIPVTTPSSDNDLVSFLQEKNIAEITSNGSQVLINTFSG